MSTRKRYAVVGAGARAETFVRSLVTAHRDRAELVAFADVNVKRIAAHNRWLGEIGHPAVPAYHADADGSLDWFATMLTRPDLLKES